MAFTASRTRLGEHFSEGSRQLWLAMLARGWSLNKAAREIGTTTGMLSPWLFGDRKPDIDRVNKIAEVLGVEPPLWSKPPAEAFDVAATQAALVEGRLRARRAALAPAPAEATP